MDSASKRQRKACARTSRFVSERYLGYLEERSSTVLNKIGKYRIRKYYYYRFYMRIKPVLIAIAILAVIAIAGFLLWQTQMSAVPTVEEPSKSLGGQIFEETGNPLKEKFTETNPFTETETNPLDAVYKNPF